MSGKNIFLKFSQASQPKEASSGRVVGERGRNDLPPGKKGGETMTPDRHYEHKQHTFDCFCKKVLKCEAYNGYREISRRQPCRAPCRSARSGCIRSRCGNSCSSDPRPTWCRPAAHGADTGWGLPSCRASDRGGQHQPGRSLRTCRRQRTFPGRSRPRRRRRTGSAC